MSLSFIHYQSSMSEITHPKRDDPGPCSPQHLQLTDSPSPELFDQECDNDEEVSEFRCSSDRMKTLFNSSRDTNPAISTRISTLSAFTDSTDSSYGIASSRYSFDFPSSESDYLNPSESEFESHCSVTSERRVFNSPVEFTDPLPYIPPLDPAEAHGTMDFKPIFLADGYSTAMQQLESVTCVNPAVLSAHVIPDAEAQMVPVQRPFESPHSPFPSTRKHNLDTYIGTHNKEAYLEAYPNTLGDDYSTSMQQLESVTPLYVHMISDPKKPFKCPRCSFSYAREHELETHLETHDKETYTNSLADDYSTVRQQFESVTHVDDLSGPSLHVISDSKVQPTAADKKPFKCPHEGCSFSSARKHNLKTHVGTHDKEASKRFECCTCKRRFSRKHDLHRHRETRHGYRMSSSSAPSFPGRHLNLRPQYRTTTVSEDGRLMSSIDPDTGLEDLTARWDYATWLREA